MLLFMSRKPSVFRQRDVSRAIRAVRAAGAEIARVEVAADGKISIVVGAAEAPSSAPESPLDDWMAAHARKSQGR
jgi:hypothetical protein